MPKSCCALFFILVVILTSCENEPPTSLNSELKNSSISFGEFKKRTKHLLPYGFSNFDGLAGSIDKFIEQANTEARALVQNDYGRSKRSYSDLEIVSHSCPNSPFGKSGYRVKGASDFF